MKSEDTTEGHDDDLPSPGGVPAVVKAAAAITAPNGFDEKLWDRTVRKIRADKSRLEEHSRKFNTVLLPSVCTIGEDANNLVGKKDEATQKSAVGALARDTGISRSQLQQFQSVQRTLSNEELCGIVAKELGVESVTTKQMCAYVLDKGLTLSHVIHLGVIRKGKEVHSLIEKTADKKFSVRDLRAEIEERTKASPALLTDAAKRRDMQKQTEAEKKKKDGKKSTSGSIGTPVQACQAAIARAEAYQDISGDLLIQFEHIETLESDEAKKAKKAIEELQERLVELQDTIKANLDSAKKALKKVKA
jgi:hypothetical protein